MQLKNKTVVVTGGTSGIGYHMVQQLYQDNKVLVIARPSLRLDNLLATFPNISVYAADLSDPSKYELIADRIIKEHKTIDVLINNAAVQNTPTYLDNDFIYDSIQPEMFGKRRTSQLNQSTCCWQGFTIICIDLLVIIMYTNIKLSQTK